MKVGAILLVATFAATEPVVAQQRTSLLPEKEVAALANEISGETAKRNLEGLARLHRQRGSLGFHAAAELVAERARAYGLSDVAILQFPADGKILYGTQRSRPGWDAEEGELEEVKAKSGETAAKIASYRAMPIVLAEDSESAEVTAELVDVGEGAKESDYAGKDVKGKIVLVSAQPGAVQDLAAGEFGAAGIVSYAQNQKTAWWGEDENSIRWGHLETFSPNKTFGFMVSLKTARRLREHLGRGETIRLHAVVKAGQHASNYEVVTATIPGADAKLKEGEIAFSCHLDHQRPGANDNASGCVTILEVARTLQKLIAEGKLARPARTMRFFWPPEIEGTLALLNGKPEFARRIKAAVHMDMVGGGPSTKAVFHVTRGPMSLPSFVHDVAWAFAEFVNEQSYKFAATGNAEYPLVAPEGGKEPLRAEYSAYTMGSDHDVYQDSSFGIPAIYLNDWPDRYIHTNFEIHSYEFRHGGEYRSDEAEEGGIYRRGERVFFGGAYQCRYAEGSCAGAHRVAVRTSPLRFPGIVTSVRIAECCRLRRDDAAIRRPGNGEGRFYTGVRYGAAGLAADGMGSHDSARNAPLERPRRPNGNPAWRLWEVVGAEGAAEGATDGVWV